MSRCTKPRRCTSRSVRPSATAIRRISSSSIRPRSASTFASVGPCRSSITRYGRPSAAPAESTSGNPACLRQARYAASRLDWSAVSRPSGDAPESGTFTATVFPPQVARYTALRPPRPISSSMLSPGTSITAALMLPLRSWRYRVCLTARGFTGLNCTAGARYSPSEERYWRFRNAHAAGLPMPGSTSCSTTIHPSYDPERSSRVSPGKSTDPSPSSQNTPLRSASK